MTLLFLALASGLLVAIAIPALLPLMRHYAMARPNARSSHVVPTPQGAGIAIVGAVVAVALAAWALGWVAVEGWRLGVIVAALVGLGLVGWRDDVQPMPVLPRLGLQTLAVVAVVAALPPGQRILPAVVPGEIELVLLVLAGVWVVNLTNFMDGIDWMTVAEIAPFAAGAWLLVALGAAPLLAGVIAAPLLGAMLGFAPFNLPGARALKVFLGDVGSLPIGLAVFAIAALVARHGHLASALLLGLYYLADATLTLLRRAAKRQPVWEAHREHFYQRATTAGLSVPQVIARVAGLNLVLVVLAVLAAFASGAWVQGALVAAGLAVTGFSLAEMTRSRGGAGR
jgi:UDP-N-acetylmuramyl pentapeptide phosphotransferase/UDP-N-acetylglucosamine-1-phosphate transferase